MKMLRGREGEREEIFSKERREEERKREEKDVFSYEIRDSSLLIGVFYQPNY